MMSEFKKITVTNFKSAISSKDSINIIAEIKKQSPSKGILVKNFDLRKIATDYEQGGAKAISVLTESNYFSGNYDYIKQVKEKVSLPVLCKDFIIDDYQIYHARFIHADAVLLIVAILEKTQLKDYIRLAKENSLDALVEVHDEKEAEIALEAKADIIGVNNRNLNDFSLSLETSINLSKIIPDKVIKVTESGIFSRVEIDKLTQYGYNNFLIGESLMKSDNRIALLQSLIK